MKILLIAYASEPNAGSEYGVGWMVPTTMAAEFPQMEIYVLTRSRCRGKIENALRELGMRNLRFFFYDVPKWMTYPNEVKSRWGEQINYLVWQILSRRFVHRLHKEIRFDVVHHLTFNQYRTPSPGFWLEDVPFVMGPIGGAEMISPVLWRDLEAHTLRKERFRRRGLDLPLFGWMTRRKKNRKLILCSSYENLQALKTYASVTCRVEEMAAIGYDEKDFILNKQPKENGEFSIVYAGKALDWKGLHLFLRAADRAFDAEVRKQIQINLVGIRFEEEQRKVMAWAEETGLTEQISLVPFMPRSELLELEATCHLQVYPAFRDSGSMSVLEGCALACPTICLDAGGQDIFDDDIVLKVSIGRNYEETVEHFAKQLRWAFANRDQLPEIGENARRWVSQHLTWKSKVQRFVAYYRELTENTASPS
ncbi:MAG: glycosyltransferase family 4 protein [Bacteroidales bacterium]|nr:glycosyltransferase family 4 protein [Bacteroidales bacterium]